MSIRLQIILASCQNVDKYLQLSKKSAEVGQSVESEVGFIRISPCKEAVGHSDGGSVHFHYQVWGRILIAQIQMIPPSLGISSADAEAE